MIDLTTEYAGLRLKNPIVVASSGLTRNLRTIKELEAAGAAAVVLKSLFEEQIEAEMSQIMSPTDYPEAADYINAYVQSNEISKHLDFLREVKQEVSIPVIASINCFRSDSWVDFAKQFEDAGADALEINVMRLDTDLFYDANKTEQMYVNIISSLVRAVKIPVTVKLSKTFSNIPSIVDKLRAAGAKGVVLFNRSYQPDIDIEKVQMVAGNVFSHAGEISDTIRYAGIVSALVPGISIASSTGVHDAAGVIKCILAGAHATQMCTALYKEGPGFVAETLAAVEGWMDRKGYRSVSEFRGYLSAGGIKSATMYERMQFMKYFSNKEN
ncbi:dihydroorotate dehydrogenase-like protein [Porphyromonas loveana]|uniref:dihydroorotate dehydrogenase-like protein n=1 Tax=Porphyromonas loveana TaxID=1884669 RepID=UPI0035A050DD